MIKKESKENIILYLIIFLLIIMVIFLSFQLIISKRETQMMFDSWSNIFSKYIDCKCQVVNVEKIEPTSPFEVKPPLMPERPDY